MHGYESKWEIVRVYTINHVFKNSILIIFKIKYLSGRLLGYILLTMHLDIVHYNNCDS